jgi:hypothetical protein
VEIADDSRRVTIDIIPCQTSTVQDFTVPKFSTTRSPQCAAIAYARYARFHDERRKDHGEQYLRRMPEYRDGQRPV